MPVREPYGMAWPEGVDQFHVELTCYRHESFREVSGLPAAEHFMRAIQCKFPPSVYKITPWSALRIRRFCENEECIWIGAGSVGKSCDAAMIAYIDFLAAPNETATTIYSTTKPLLRKRIWRDLVRFYNHDSCGLYYRKTDFMITPAESGDTNNYLAGASVLRDDGTVAVTNLHGVHNKRNRVIIDEAQGMPYIVIESMANAGMAGSLDEDNWKVLEMGNPEDLGDTLCREGEPEAGWESIDVEAEEWRAKSGACVLHFDGLKSPALAEPKEYPFLLRQKDIDRVRARFGENSIRFLSQVRGWLPMGATLETVTDWITLRQTQSFEKEIAASRPTWFAGLDPAFATGGDRAMFSIAQVFQMSGGKWIIQFEDETHLQLRVTEDKALTYNMVADAVEILNRRSVAPDHFGIDTTGTQRTVADVFDHEWSRGRRVIRCDFGGNPSDRVVDPNGIDGQDRTARDIYGNRVSELWGLFGQFVAFGHIRGLSEGAAREAVARRTHYTRKKTWVATKKEVKRITGQSPDNMDSKVVLVDAVVRTLGLMPGQGLKRKGSRHIPMPEPQMEPAFAEELLDP